MRLYKKIKPLLSGATPSKTNKGVLLINTSASVVNCSVNILNVDDTISTLELTINSISANTISLGTFPNFTLIPFHVTGWTSASAINGYELF